MKKFLLACGIIIGSVILIVYLVSLSEPSAPVQKSVSPYGLLINKIEAGAIIKDLPLTHHQNLKSGNGRTKQYWKIRGAQNFEIIGNNQNDADLAAWHCVQFDKSGSSISYKNMDNMCPQFFEKVLNNIVDKPQELAISLLSRANGVDESAAIIDIGDFRFEADGEFFFIRRISRIENTFKDY